MPQNILRPNHLQRIFQVQHQLPQVTRIFGIVRILREQDRANLLGGHTRAVAVNQNRKQFLCLFSFKGEDFPVIWLISFCTAFGVMGFIR